MAGPPYAVAPNFRKPNTMSFQCFLKFSPCINHLGLTGCEARALRAQAALTFWRTDYRGANSVFFIAATPRLESPTLHDCYRAKRRRCLAACTRTVVALTM